MFRLIRCHARSVGPGSPVGIPARNTSWAYVVTLDARARKRERKDGADNPKGLAAHQDSDKSKVRPKTGHAATGAGKREITEQDLPAGRKTGDARVANPSRDPLSAPTRGLPPGQKSQFSRRTREGARRETASVTAAGIRPGSVATPQVAVERIPCSDSTRVRAHKVRAVFKGGDLARDCRMFGQRSSHYLGPSGRNPDGAAWFPASLRGFVSGAA